MTKHHPYSRPDQVEALKFALLRRVALYCMWLHVVLFGAFWHLQVETLAIVNIGSVTMWYIGIKLIDNNKPSLALRVFCLEVALHATLVCAYLGMSLGFQYYLWTVSCLMLLDYQLKLRHAVIYSVVLITLFATLKLLFDDVIYHYRYQELVPYVHFANVLICGIPMIYTISHIRKMTVQQRDELAELAAHDPLTKMFNRRYAKELITHAKESCISTHSPLCLVMADIDHFKKINDTFGHGKGDKILKTVAKTIQSHMLPADIAVRWGGEEFLIVLAPCSGDEAMRRIEQLRQATENIKFENNIIKITMSFGITNWDHSESFEQAIHHADAALYRSKELGRNCITTAPSISTTQTS
ncbi:GGDEF domain-containing protein [Pseudoalteromonas peptidolytica]|uniref:GGDEF domain-containing protein n=1 Tax=Pseudoalteromonas peptidolytica TaxID=61150 RepID=UPI00298E78F1|nr:diguanylate cyclase [Pseudoalteromonas peptidolytica]MDW7551085.1 diguanylate cyclase [Pseudoalteromonas peptidolytica]